MAVADETLTTDDTDSTSKVDWLKWMCLLTTLLGCSYLMAHNHAEEDLWGHVQYGRDVFTHGFTHENTYSYTAQGYRWVNHENLAELTYAIVADWGGGRALLLFKLATGMVVILLLLRFEGTRELGLPARCVMCLLVAFNVAFVWTVRPQVFTFLFLTIMIALLRWCFDGWEGHWNLPWLKRLARADSQPGTLCTKRLRWLWLLPLILFLWTNAHGGFVAGYCILGAYMVCRSGELLVSRGRDGWPMIGYFALIVVVTGCATLINPYGWNLHFWLIESLGIPRPEITEWVGMSWDRYSFKPFISIAVIAVLALLFSNRSLDMTHLVLMAAVIWQLISHERHIPFFAIMAGFWITSHFDSALGRLWRKPSTPTPTATRAVCCVVLGLVSLLLIPILYVNTHHVRVDRSRFPVAAVHFMVEHNLKGKLVVPYNWGQYVIGVMGARTPADEGILVSMDGRFRTCYPQETVDVNFDFEVGMRQPERRFRSPNSPPASGERVLENLSPNLVLHRAFRSEKGIQGHAAYVMFLQRQKEESEWVLLFQDGLAQLWGRRSVYDDPNSPQYIPSENRSITESFVAGTVAWPAAPSKRWGSGSF